MGQPDDDNPPVEQQPAGVVWNCPFCLRDAKAPSDAALFWVVRNHIKDHVLQGVADAIEQERVSPGSSLARSNAKDRLPLTIADRNFLRSLHIGWEG